MLLADVRAIVEVLALRVKPLVVFVSQATLLATIVHVPEPIVTVRVLVLLDENAPTVTLKLFALNVPEVKVNVLVAPSVKASNSLTVEEVLIVMGKSNVFPLEVILCVVLPLNVQTFAPDPKVIPVDAVTFPEIEMALLFTVPLNPVNDKFNARLGRLNV